MTPDEMDAALLRAIAAGRRGLMAKVAPSDLRILEAAKRSARRPPDERVPESEER